MYNELEKYYKKNSKQIKTRKKITAIYVTILIIAFIINSSTPGDWLTKTIICLSVIIIITFISALALSCINKKKYPLKNKNTKLDDYKLVEDYLQENNLLTKEALCVIKNHYLIKTKNTESPHFLEILLAATTVITSFISNKEIGSENIVKPLLISIAIIAGVLIVYFATKSYYNYYRFLTGNDDLYETLENITTILYLKTITDNSILSQNPAFPTEKPPKTNSNHNSSKTNI